MKISLRQFSIHSLEFLRYHQKAAVHRLVVHECPISPSTIIDYQDDSLEDEQMVTTHHDLPNVSTPDTRYTVTYGINASIFLHYTLALLQITLYLFQDDQIHPQLMIIILGTCLRYQCG